MKTLTKLLFSYLLLQNHFVTAQSVFSKLYDPFTSWYDYSWNIYCDSNQIFWTYGTSTGYGFSGYTFGSIVNLDLSGNVLTQNNYIDTNNMWYFGGPGSLTKAHTGFILGGSKDTLGAQAFLLRLDEWGDTTWTKTYGDTNFQSGWCAKPAHDGGFYLCGQDNTYGSLIKTDSLGNIIYQTKLGGLNKRVLFYSVAATLDGGCALAGRWRDISGEFDIYVTKLDSSGVKQWDTIYSTTEFDEARSVIATKDSNIVVAGFYSLSFGAATQPFIAKYDYSGNVIWEKHFGDTVAATGFFSARELNDGSFILCGQVVPEIPQSAIYGMIYKISSNGDSLWSYNYYSSYYGNNYLQDIYPIPEGGFISCGFTVPQLPDSGHQDLWLLRVDSLGCVVTNCTILIPEIENSALIKVYPNPIVDEFVIDFSKEGDYRIQVYNSMGVKLKEFKSDGSILNIDASQLQFGILFINILESGKRIFSGKICHIK